MTPISGYTEDSLVQQTTAEYLEQELGRESVYAYNTEDFGPDSLLSRDSDREVVLTRTLRAKIEELNPGLPATAYEDAVRQIVTVSSAQTLLATNREKYELIKDGVQVTFHNDKGERVRQRLRVFDFDCPENNHFLCVRELWVRGDLYRRRADIVGFVNGLPLLFMELKNVSKDIRAAYEQNFLDYKDTVSLYYDARGDKLGVAVGDLNDRIAEKLEQIETQDIDVEQRLEQELKRDYHIIKADKRLDQVARDFVRHYSTAWETGKAMLVCIDKITCVRMYDLIAKYWNERITGLEAELSSAADEQDEQYRRRQFEWMPRPERLMWSVRSRARSRSFASGTWTSHRTAD